MAITNVEGFDLYSDANAPVTNTYAVSTSTGSQSMTAGRFGGQALRLTSVTSTVIQVLTLPMPAAVAGVTCGMAWRMSHNSFVNRIASLRNSGTSQISIFALTDGSVQVVQGATQGTNVIATSSTGLLIPGVWYYFEFLVTRNASTGSVQIYLDGTSVVNASSVNTGSSNINEVALYQTGGITGTSTNCDYDDIYIANTNSRIGPARVETLVATTDVSVAWTPNSGPTNYTQVDDAPSDGDTTYVSSSTVGQKDKYGLADLSATPTSIYAVCPTIMAKKDDATVRTIRSNLVSGATTQNGTTRTMTSSYTQYADVRESDPNTSAAWTASGVNALNQEIEVVS